MLDQLGRADTDPRLGARIFDVVADVLIVRDTSALKDVLPGTTPGLRRTSVGSGSWSTRL